MEVEINNLADLRKYLLRRLAHYKFPSADLARYDRSMASLIERHNDPNFYLGIVGEFSAGKSTFINALLGVDILKEDILPGTTCAPTFIGYGVFFDIVVYSVEDEILFKYSSCNEKTCNDDGLADSTKQGQLLTNELDNARALIHRYTAEEDNARKVSRVVVSLPCENQLFKAGIVVVDTPGINVTIKRHQEVTSYMVQHCCDLALVLTPATSPCSETLLCFARENLLQSQEHCIGLITQIDRIRKNERKRQISYVKERFESEGIELQDVYAVSSYCVLYEEELQKKDDVQSLQEEFHYVIDHICECISSQKNQIISQRIQSVLRSIISDQINPFLVKIKAELKERYDSLYNNKLSNFDKFFTINKDMANVALESSIPSMTELAPIAHRVRLYLERDLKERIQSAKSKSELKNATSSMMMRYSVNKVKSEVLNAEVEVIRNKICNAAQSAYLRFETDFNIEFRNLDGVAKKCCISQKAELESVFLGRSLTSVMSVQEEIEGQKKVMIGGAVLGGIIGLCFGAPWIGALIGGGFASLFGKSLGELKREAGVKLVKSMDAWEKCLSKHLEDELKKYYEETRMHLNEQIIGFLEYRPVIEQIIRTERYQQSSLKRLITKIDYDKQLLCDIALKPSRLLSLKTA